MKNCLILGSGRSGTSMLAGILNENGYYCGDNLYPARNSNPKGFFENSLINSMNESIIDHNISFQKNTIKNDIYNPGKGRYWLLSLEVNDHILKENDSIADNIKSLFSKQPFAFKDPRFSYTLSVYKKYAPPDLKTICIFREPDITAYSILKECYSQNYLKSFNISILDSYELIFNIYNYILLNYNNVSKHDIFFIHYNQLFDNSILNRLSEYLEINLINNFSDQNLKRSSSIGYIPDRNLDLYRKLCDLAGYIDDYNVSRKESKPVKRSQICNSYYYLLENSIKSKIDNEELKELIFQANLNRKSEYATIHKELTESLNKLEILIPKNQQIKEKEQRIRETNQKINEMNMQIKERDGIIMEKNSEVLDLSKKIRYLQKELDDIKGSSIFRLLRKLSIIK
jgi:hypothetical protein